MRYERLSNRENERRQTSSYAEGETQTIGKSKEYIIFFICEILYWMRFWEI